MTLANLIGCLLTTFMYDVLGILHPLFLVVLSQKGFVSNLSTFK